jgi:hypothetical protein
LREAVLYRFAVCSSPVLSRGLDQTSLSAIATNITTIATYSALAVQKPYR